MAVYLYFTDNGLLLANSLRGRIRPLPKFSRLGMSTTCAGRPSSNRPSFPGTGAADQRSPSSRRRPVQSRLRHFEAREAFALGDVEQLESHAARPSCARLPLHDGLRGDVEMCGEYPRTHL